jgi:hypothetical protein
MVVGELVVVVSCDEEEKGQCEMGQFRLKDGCQFLRVSEKRVVFIFVGLEVKERPKRCGSC